MEDCYGAWRLILSPTRAELLKFEAAHTAWAQARGARTVPVRVGRSKACVVPGGAHFSGTCVAADEASDLALLEADTASLGTLGSLSLGAPGADASGTAVLAVGNPYDWDLEAASGAAPRKNGFTPFWTSSGKLEGELSAAAAAAKGVGAQARRRGHSWLGSALGSAAF